MQGYEESLHLSSRQKQRQGQEEPQDKACKWVTSGLGGGWPKCYMLQRFQTDWELEEAIRFGH